MLKGETSSPLSSHTMLYQYVEHVGHSYFLFTGKTLVNFTQVKCIDTLLK